MSRSAAEIESAFSEQIAAERKQGSRAYKRVLRRSLQRQQTREHKRGSFRFAALVLTLIATAVGVTIAMFETLYYVLVELSKIAAPFIPFLSEAIYRNLRLSNMAQSVHLLAYPQYHQESRDKALEEGMEGLQLVVSLGHALRKEHKLKVRQPLPRAHVVCTDAQLLNFLCHQDHLIADELNVKEVQFHEKQVEFVKFTIRPNFRVLVKKV